MIKPPDRAFDRVLVIMFENQFRAYVMANPYFRGLAAQGIDMASYFGVMHPSQTNYIASIAGELCNVSSDDQPSPLLPQRTIVDLVEESPFGLRWRAYMDSYVPQNCPWSPTLDPAGAFPDYPYVIKHNPFSSFANIVRHEARWQKIVDEAQLFKDVLNGDLPEYAWFTPNMWNDGHYTIGTQVDPTPRAPALVDQAAAWLEGFFGALRFPGPDSHLPPRTLVVITFDESDFRADWETHLHNTSGYDGPNQIYTVLLGDHLAPAVERETANHYSLLRTIERNFGLGTLGKNDAGANWFRFLWGERFRWGASEPARLSGTGPVAVAALEGLLLVVQAEPSGRLCLSVERDGTWSDAQPFAELPGRVSELAFASRGRKAVLVATDGRGIPVSFEYDLVKGWHGPGEPLAPEPVSGLALTGFGADEFMVAWRAADGRISTRRHRAGAWDSPKPTRHSTDGGLSLGALGASLFLVFRLPHTARLAAITYNTADFNVVTVSSSPANNTTRDAWSPTAFEVGRFGAAPWKGSQGEDEPDNAPVESGDPFVLVELDGVLHLVHPGVRNGLLLEETFSVAGVLTPHCPVSYQKGDGSTTSDGFGTLAEAGWTRQCPVNGASLFPPGHLAATRAGDEIVLLHTGSHDGKLYLCRGRYERGECP